MLRRGFLFGTSPTLRSRHMSVVAKSLKYTQHGEPQDVLQLVEDKLPDPKDKQVLVKILAAPINPADINTIQGMPGCKTHNKYIQKAMRQPVPNNTVLQKTLRPIDLMKLRLDYN